MHILAVLSLMDKYSVEWMRMKVCVSKGDSERKWTDEKKKGKSTENLLFDNIYA